MVNRYIILTILIFLINNIVIWYQLNGQLVWDFWKTPRGIFVSLILGIPITALFWLATKWGYHITILLIKTITLKTFITIILSIIIMLLQLL